MLPNFRKTISNLLQQNQNMMCVVEVTRNSQITNISTASWNNVTEPEALAELEQNYLHGIRMRTPTCL